MTHEYLTKPEVSNVQHCDRFVAMTQQIGAIDDVKNFEKGIPECIQRTSLFEGTSGYTHAEAAERP